MIIVLIPILNCVVRWFVYRGVQLSSIHTGIEPLTTVRRCDRREHKYIEIEVECPHILTEYNEHGRSGQI